MSKGGKGERRNTVATAVRSGGVGKEGSKEGKYCRKQRINRASFLGEGSLRKPGLGNADVG